MRRALALLVLAVPAWSDGFWAHWGDGKAELDGYRLTQPRYAAKRSGTAVLIYVTEDFSDSLRVKADPGRHPKSDVYPVLKLNELRDFQTGLYDYNVMTSTFARVAPGWPVVKLSFSSQEWCGHVWRQLLPRAGRLESASHSYFDQEGDAQQGFLIPAEAVYEDALGILVRGWGGSYLRPGEQRTVPFLPSLLSHRLGHKPLAFTRARIGRAARTKVETTPAGRFVVTEWTVAEQGGPTTRYLVEAAPPYRLVRRSSDTGEDLLLLGSTRLAYWEMNRPGGEIHLKKLGLALPIRTR